MKVKEVIEETQKYLKAAEILTKLLMNDGIVAQMPAKDRAEFEHLRRLSKIILPQDSKILENETLMESRFHSFTIDKELLTTIKTVTTPEEQFRAEQLMIEKYEFLDTQVLEGYQSPCEFCGKSTPYSCSYLTKSLQDEGFPLDVSVFKL